ncbi:DUF5685 family protein [Clostridium rectalis]|uniref:DUF5685 family protein n=1 Tax=Clostridium rectalis TaxID=2040295 RepID=UPI000F6375E6|nr:DUF5685 family protein [Clostridium rectalis]
MFGYVTPCKMELKIKDYEKFKAYYCGLCKSIKINYGNIPRATLNYDMTFLAILLDSLNNHKCCYEKQHCLVHPMRKKVILLENSSLKYAAFCNTTLSYYKLLDNVNDDNSIKSKLFSILLGKYINKSMLNFKVHAEYIEKKLTELYNLENNNHCISLDSISDPFADLTGYIISSYIKKDASLKKDLYNLGYNLGKWIYIIDAFDDLEKDLKNKKFNPLNVLFNENNLSYNELYEKIYMRINFTLTNCARHCLLYLQKLDIKKNKELLYNILQYGLMEKMDKVFKRSEIHHDKSL